jgi:hypothetical protein
VEFTVRFGACVGGGFAIGIGFDFGFICCAEAVNESGGAAGTRPRQQKSMEGALWHARVQAIQFQYISNPSSTCYNSMMVR